MLDMKHKPKRWAFSKAAATRSLSASCLLTAVSLACVPGAIVTSTLNLGGNDLNNFTTYIAIKDNFMHVNGAAFIFKNQYAPK